MFTGFHGLTYNCPVEINEARNGIYIDRLELNPDDDGELDELPEGCDPSYWWPLEYVYCEDFYKS